MKVKAFTKSKHVGNFCLTDCIKNKELLAVGALVRLKDVIYCVNNVAVNSKGEIIIEINA